MQKNDYLKCCSALALAILLMVLLDKNQRIQPVYYPHIADCSALPCESGYDESQTLRAFWKVFVNEKFGRIMEEHIRRMRKANYFEKIGKNDLDHGHLMLKKGCREEYSDISRLSEDAANILYHTRELQFFWHKQALRNIPLEKRTPRSILGYLDGKIEPAINQISDPNVLDERYYQHGTIFPQQLYDLYSYHRDEDSIRLWLNNKWLKVELSVNIEIDPIGRFECGGERFEIYFKCYEQ